MAGILDSINTLLSPLGTNFALKGMLERCLAARTKAEEKEVVGRCLALAEERLRQVGTSAGEAARCLAMACFATTLGYDTSFAAVHAVKMAQNNSLAAKRVGYLSCSVLISERDPLALLLVNTVARDLCAGNALAVTLALAACTGAVSIALGPQLLPLVLDKLAHPVAAVRARAVAVLHRHLKTCGEAALTAVIPLLGDDDPAVAAATLPFFASSLKVFPNALDRVALAEALAGFQRQVLQGRMPAQMRRHDISAPFAQAQAIRLLTECGSPTNQVLQLIVDTLESSFNISTTTTNQIASVPSATPTIGHGTKSGSGLGEEPARTTPHPSTETTPPGNRNTSPLPAGGTPARSVTPTAEEILRRVSPARAMVVLECVQALTALASSDELREKAATYAAMLVANDDVNVRCAGLAALASLRIPAPAAQASLTASCTTERRLAVQLLAATSSAEGAKAACLRLTQHCHQHCANEPAATDELVVLAVRLIDEFPGDWSVPALVRLLALAPSAHAPALRKRLQDALAPGTGQDQEALDALRRRVLRALSQHARLRAASTALLEAFVWTLARFPYLLEPDLPVSQSQGQEDSSGHVADQSEICKEAGDLTDKAKNLNDTASRDVDQSEDSRRSRYLSEQSEDSVDITRDLTTESDAPLDQWDWEAAMRGQQRLADLGLRAVRSAAAPRLLVAVGDAAMQLVAAAGAVEPEMQRLITELCSHATRRGRLRDCATELRACAVHAARLRTALALTAQPAQRVIDSTLSCADAFVCRALADGACAYRPRPIYVGHFHKEEEPATEREESAKESVVSMETISREPAVEEEEATAWGADAWGAATRTVWSPGGRVCPEPGTEIDVVTNPDAGLSGEDEASTSGDDFEQLAADIAAMHR